MIPTIRYWQLRGRIEVTRMMFEVAGQEYKAVYQDFNTWEQDKQILLESGENAQGLLPIYHDDEVGTVTQSKAIARYVAEKLGFLGKNRQERLRIDEYCEAIMEVMEAFITSLYSPDCLERKEETKEEQDSALRNLENFLFSEKKPVSSNPGKHLVGNSLSLADFYLVSLLDQYLPFRPDSLAQMEKLSAYRKQFHQIPRFKEYCESDRRPMVQNGPYAYFGAKAEETQQRNE